MYGRNSHHWHPRPHGGAGGAPRAHSAGVPYRGAPTTAPPAGGGLLAAGAGTGMPQQPTSAKPRRSWVCLLGCVAVTLLLGQFIAVARRHHLLGIDRVRVPAFYEVPGSQAHTTALPPPTPDLNEADVLAVRKALPTGKPGGQGGALVAVIIPVRSDYFPQKLVVKCLDGVTLPVVVVLVGTAKTMDAHPLLEAKKRLQSNNAIIFHSIPATSNLTNISNLQVRLYHAGVHAAPASTSHYLFMHSSLVPRTTGTFISTMLEHFGANPKVGMVACPVTMPTGIGRLILDLGGEFSMGNSANYRNVYVTRRVAGFTVSDARFRTANVELAQSHCLMIAAATYRLVGGFFDVGADKSASSLTAVDGETDRPSVSFGSIFQSRLKRLDESLVGLALNEVASGDAAFRTAVLSAIEANTAAITLYEEVTKRDFRTAQLAFPALRPDALADENALFAPVREMTPAQKYQFLAGQLRVAQQQFEPLSKDSLAGAGSTDAIHTSEDEAGWDLSCRVRDHKLLIVVETAADVLVTSQRHKQADLEAFYFQSVLLPASVLLSTGFVERWKHRIVQTLPAVASRLGTAVAGSVEAIPMEVYWYAWCCECCGFLNEIVSLVVPLQRLMTVSVIPGHSCFCPGFAQSVVDTVVRLHVEPKKIVRDRKDVIIVWISHTDPSMYKDFSLIGAPQFQPDYIIGRSMYEFTRIDEMLVSEANRLADEVWVPAKFVKKLYNDSGVKVPLTTIGEAVDTHLFDPERLDKHKMPPTDLGWFHWCNALPADQSDRYRFFSDFKWEPRKGWDILFPAYFLAFRLEEPVTLYVLSHVWNTAQGFVSKHNITAMYMDLLEQAAKYPELATRPLAHFCIISQDLTQKGVAELYNSMHAFVLPTKGEGWGLPTMQAMAMGMPTITTDWGGNTEFAKPWNAFLIRLDAVEEIPADSVYHHRPGKKWGVGSVSHTSELMRYVYTNRDGHAKKVGQRARAYVLENFSEEAMGKRVAARLEEVKLEVVKRRQDALKAIGDKAAQDKRAAAEKAKRDARRAEAAPGTTITEEHFPEEEPAEKKVEKSGGSTYRALGAMLASRKKVVTHFRKTHAPTAKPTAEPTTVEPETPPPTEGPETSEPPEPATEAPQPTTEEQTAATNAPPTSSSPATTDAPPTSDAPRPV